MKIMQKWKFTTLKHQIAVVVVTMNILVVLFACLACWGILYNAQNNTPASQIKQQVALLANDFRHFIQTNDTLGLQHTLIVLNNDPRIAGCVFKNGHNLFISESAKNRQQIQMINTRQNSLPLDFKSWDINQTIYSDSNATGELYIKLAGTTSPPHFYSWLIITIVICLFTGSLSWVVSQKLSDVIWEPVNRVDRFLDDVCSDNNYSLRLHADLHPQLNRVIAKIHTLLDELKAKDENLSTFQQRFDEQVELKTRELNAANKAKSEFLANTSHELRTPLNVILGFTDLLKDSITDEVQKQYLNNIAISGRNLLGLINDVLDLSKIESEHMQLTAEPVSIRTMLKELAEIHSYPAAQKELKFMLEMDPKLPECVLLDGTRLRQILINLIGNALKFTERGYVKLSVRCEPTTENAVQLFISVEDTGVGIPEDQRERIFSAFVQRDGQDNRKYGGTGLGLTISKKLANLMNGDIFVESKVGKGSTFTVALYDVPVIDAAIEQENQQDNAKSEKRTVNIEFKRATVLVVEDDDATRQLLKEYIANANLNIIEAQNGIEALNKLKVIRPDVILTDIKMPLMDGHQLIRKIRNDDRLKHIPIVVISANALTSEKQQTMALGVDKYLCKPISREAVLDVLVEYLPFREKTIAHVESDAPQQTQQQEMSPALKENIEAANRLIEKLQNGLMDTWEEVSSTMVTTDIREFGQQIKMLGSEHMVTSLHHYGEMLEKYASNFQIEELCEVLKDYPKVVSELQNQLTHQNSDKN